MNFSEELAIYYFLKGRLSNQYDWNQINKYTEIRNRTMHSKNMHIKDQLKYSSANENLRQILQFLGECRKIIDDLLPSKH